LLSPSSDAQQALERLGVATTAIEQRRREKERQIIIIIIEALCR
jgi:hypothetical protein